MLSESLILNNTIKPVKLKQTQLYKPCSKCFNFLSTFDFFNCLPHICFPAVVTPICCGVQWSRWTGFWWSSSRFACADWRWRAHADSWCSAGSWRQCSRLSLSHILSTSSQYFHLVVYIEAQYSLILSRRLIWMYGIKYLSTTTLHQNHTCLSCKLCYTSKQHVVQRVWKLPQWLDVFLIVSAFQVNTIIALQN